MEAVPTSSPGLEHAILVGHGDGQTVDLQLADVVEGGIIDQAPVPGLPCLELLQVEGIGKTEEWQPVLDGGEGIAGGRPNALRRRVGRHEAGVGLFHVLQLPKQQVVLVVADLGVVKDVVAIVVMAQAFAQVGGSLLEAGGAGA